MITQNCAACKWTGGDYHDDGHGLIEAAIGFRVLLTSGHRVKGRGDADEARARVRIHAANADVPTADCFRSV